MSIHWIAAKKHDITGIRVYDIREQSMPNLGMVPMLDAETGVMQIVDTVQNRSIMKNIIMNNWIILKILLVSRFRCCEYKSWRKLCNKVTGLF
jgi:hypothetical protein